MRLPPWFIAVWSWLDYGLAVPLLARLPRWLAGPLMALRARVNHRWDLDWRTLALGHGFVRAATGRALRRVMPEGTPQAVLDRLTLERYRVTAREEVDCRRLGRIDYARLPHQIMGLEALREASGQGRGVVLLTAHYDSLYIGLVLLARAGLQVHLLGSRITEDPRVPPAISRHFRHKVGTLGQLLAPGAVTYVEDGLLSAVRALRRGGVVVIACDGVSTSPDRAEAVRFLDGRYRLATGPQFLAQATGAALALYSAQEDADGIYRVRISRPRSLADAGLQAAYQVLEDQIRAQPGRWWGCDQMRDYQPVMEPDPPSLLLVCGVNRWDVAQRHLLASPCLQRGALPLVLRWNAGSAAEAMNPVLDGRPAQRWVVWVHQDVRLPEGWELRFGQALAEAEARMANLAVVGVYGVRGAGPQAQHAGHVLDRGTLLRGAPDLPCEVDSLDELLLAVRTDAGLRLDAALGFDFYATDLVLQAQARGLRAAVVDACCEHWSETPRLPPVPAALAERIARSGAVFEAKWAQRLPVTTPCFDLSHPGDMAALAQAFTQAAPASRGLTP